MKQCWITQLQVILGNSALSCYDIIGNRKQPLLSYQAPAEIFSKKTQTVWVPSQWLGTRGSVKTPKPQRKRSDFDVVLRLFTNRTLWIPLNSVLCRRHVDCNVRTLNSLRFWNTSGVTGCQTVLQSYVSRVFAINISKKSACGGLLRYNLCPGFDP